MQIKLSISTLFDVTAIFQPTICLAHKRRRRPIIGGKRLSRYLAEKIPHFDDDFDRGPHRHVPFPFDCADANYVNVLRSSTKSSIQLSHPIECTVRYFPRFNPVVSIHERSFTFTLTRTFSFVDSQKMTSDFHLSVLTALCVLKCICVAVCWTHTHHREL